MRSFSSHDLIALLKADGWMIKAQEGSHTQWVHPVKAGKVTVPHPKRDLPIKTVRSVFRQAGWPWPPR